MPQPDQQQARTAVPAVPPGLISQAHHTPHVPDERLFGPRLTQPQEEMAPMPGLGVLPGQTYSEKPNSVVSPIKEVQRYSEPTLQAANSVPTDNSIVSPKALDESFPALPKPSTTKSAIEVKQKPTKPVSEDRAPQRSNELDAKIDSPSLPVSSETSIPPVTEKQPSTLSHAAGMSQSSESAAAISTVGASAKAATHILPSQERSSTPSTSSRPTTPSQSSEVGARRNTQPRTIRVLSEKVTNTPSPQHGSRSATPPAQGAIAPGQTSGENPATPTKEPSRQPSVASAQRSATPASEKVADNMSVTSGSVSRASTPPPSNKPESAAQVKPKSKSQLKKERSDKSKALSEDKKEPLTSADAVVHEPIVGRKKKSRKSAPAPNPAANPRGVDNHTSTELEATPTEKPGEPELSLPSAGPETVNEVSIEESEPTPEPKPTTAERPLQAKIISQLVTDGLIDPTQATFFKGPASMANIRYDFSNSDAIGLQKYEAALTADELDTLEAGHPVRRGEDDNNSASRLVITPERKCLFGLTKEMEDRYLELEKRLAKMPSHQRYVHKRSEATQNLTPVDEMLKDLYSSLTRPPTTIDAAKVNAQTRSKKGAQSDNTMVLDAGSDASLSSYGEDALRFLNKFILPPIPARAGMSPTSTPWNTSTSQQQYAMPSNGDGLYSITGAEDVHLPGKDHSHIYDRVRAAGNNVDAIKQAWFEAVDELDDRQFDTNATGSNENAGIELETMEKAIHTLKKENEALDKKMATLMKRNRKLAEPRPGATIAPTSTEIRS